MIGTTCYIIHLRPEGDGPPPEIRLKRLLKAALRSFGLRCVDLRQVDREQEPAPKAVNRRPIHGPTNQRGET